ncbi:hypothetical protein GTW25_19750 [Aliihoeflea aestuarii]|jgi:hypothetical protein|uniref:hypothetical protein n=1 Tax=Aliihoeflea aestuarii TaxID=453840 RepID=UPI002094A565|nr:hypothetical protein [Aliihoeflea aestuarii]MCO6393257.1 hypothetical protein [Aliihoeflea aestuarii]
MPINWNQNSRENWLLETLRFDYEAGFVDLLFRDVSQWGKELRASGSPEVRERIAWFEREAERCAFVEDEHGKGSLLNLEHPFVQKSMDNPRILTRDHVEAARRYRQIMGTAA